MSKISLPSVLAFERKFDFSDAIFFQLNSQNPQAKAPITLREKSVRGTISNRLKNTIANDPLKLDAEVEKANLQTVDVASLHDDCDTLIAAFTLKILPFDGKPNVCNNLDYQDKVINTVKTYLEKHSLSTLALRYASNIANARWLWRNRLGAESISIHIKNKDESIDIQNAKALALNDFEHITPEIEQLAKWIQEGLMGSAYTLLEIEARALIGYGQEVYPSQELILDKGNSKKSKILYAINEKAGMHSQKIGNAIRTIDTWYSDNAEFPIAAEPYGSVTTMGTAFRQPKQRNDFYNLFDDWILKDNTPSIEQQHYLMSILIRGGVFGASSKE